MKILAIHRLKYVATIAVLLFLPLTPDMNTISAAEKPQIYRMGVFPFLPARTLEKTFAPFAASIGKSLGHQVQFNSSSSYQNFMELVDDQQYEIAFVQPFDYIRIAKDSDYLPLATRGEPLNAIIVVKEDSPIKSITDLKGKTIALPPKVAAVSLLTKDHLAKQGLDIKKDVKFRHYRSHVSCLQQIMIGTADACGTAAPPIRFFQHKMKIKLHQLAKTRPIPHALFVVNKRVPKTEREKILQTILSWSKTESGKKMLSQGRMKPFVKATDEQYNVVRNIEKHNTR